ncbi:MAG: PsbP-related protein [Candidatus Magasanikbacteria bacterium]|jgi:hypothetical protein
MINRKNLIILVGLISITAILFVVVNLMNVNNNNSGNLVSKESTTTEYLTYANKELGYSINYPSTWIISEFKPNILNNDIRIQPSNPEYLSGMPVDYIHIRLESESLATVRKVYSTQVGGNDMVESEITFAGQTAYFYSHTDYPTNEYEKEPSLITRKILLEHNGKVISFFTHKYQIPEIQRALQSFKFISN